MKKILFYINAINGGGAERVMVNLAKDFANIGVKTVLVTSFRDSWEYPVDSKVSRLSLEDEQIIQSQIKRNISRISKLRKLLKQEKPDVLVSFMREPNFRAIVASLGLPVKTIISIRNDPNRSYKGKKNAFIVKCLLPLADGCVFQTEEAKEWFPKRLQKKSAIIYNAVKGDFFNVERMPTKGEIVTCGRLEPQKNHELLIRAFAKCHEVYKDTSLKIYGDGSLKANLQELIDSLGIRDAATLCGSTTNVVEALQRADVFVLSSDYEGMPNALMEAMAVGVPCISTNCPCGGPKALLGSDGLNGTLVPVGDVDKLAQIMESYCKDPNKKKSLGINAKKRANQFRNDVVFQQWNNYINYITNK